MASKKKKDTPDAEETKRQNEAPVQQPADRLQVLANILTVLVALAAIGLSIWEGYENRLHNRLSLLPQLQNAESTVREGVNDDAYTMNFALANTGLGPAVIENIVVFRDGEQVFDAVEAGGYLGYAEITQELEQLPFYIGTFTHGRYAGELLQAGKEHVLLRMDVPVIDSLSQWTPGIVRERVMNRYSFVFCYCSVYGENCGMTYVSQAPPSEHVCSRWE